MLRHTNMKFGELYISDRITSLLVFFQNIKAMKDIGNNNPKEYNKAEKLIPPGTIGVYL